MRDPYLMSRFMKGASIHPKLKRFTHKIAKVNPVHKLTNEINHLTISHGVGMSEKRIRKPLKFLA